MGVAGELGDESVEVLAAIPEEMVKEPPGGGGS